MSQSRRDESVGVKGCTGSHQVFKIWERPDLLKDAVSQYVWPSAIYDQCSEVDEIREDPEPRPAFSCCRSSSVQTRAILKQTVSFARLEIGVSTAYCYDYKAAR